MTPDHGEPLDTPATPDWEARARYLAGECEGEECEAVRRWLAAAPREAALHAILLRATPVRATTADPDVETALRRMHDRLDAAAVTPLGGARSALRPGRWLPLALAATLVMMVGGVLVRRAAEPGPAIQPPSSFSTAVGERANVRLPDGSTVVLGPASRLVVAGAYGGASREVTLAGEAHFDVLHDAARPFVVRVGDVRIRDVGTRFSVRADPQGAVRLAVTEGAVDVEGPGGERIALRAGGAATWASHVPPAVDPRGVVEADTAWQNGRLVFADASMADVRDGLRRWYGVEIRFDSALAGRHVTATFRGEPASRVIEVIALTLGARVERRADTATMHAPARR